MQCTIIPCWCPPGNSLSLCLKGIRAQRFNDTLPSGGLAARRWRALAVILQCDSAWRFDSAQVARSGDDFTVRQCSATVRGVLTAENFNAMTSFLGNILYVDSNRQEGW